MEQRWVDDIFPKYSNSLFLKQISQTFQSKWHTFETWKQTSFGSQYKSTYTQAPLGKTNHINKKDKRKWKTKRKRKRKKEKKNVIYMQPQTLFFSIWTQIISYRWLVHFLFRRIAKLQINSSGTGQYLPSPLAVWDKDWRNKAFRNCRLCKKLIWWHSTQYGCMQNM